MKQQLKTIGAGLALAIGAGIVVTSQPAERAVAADYLVRPAAVATEATQVEASQLQDWEYTLRTRPAKCRIGR